MGNIWNDWDVEEGSRKRQKIRKKFEYRRCEIKENKCGARKDKVWKRKKSKEIQSKTGLIVNEGEFQEGIWLFLQY